MQQITKSLAMGLASMPKPADFPPGRPSVAMDVAERFAIPERRGERGRTLRSGNVLDGFSVADAAILARMGEDSADEGSIDRRGDFDLGRG